MKIKKINLQMVEAYQNTETGDEYMTIRSYSDPKRSDHHEVNVVLKNGAVHSVAVSKVKNTSTQMNQMYYKQYQNPTSTYQEGQKTMKAHPPKGNKQRKHQQRNDK